MCLFQKGGAEPERVGDHLARKRPAEVRGHVEEGVERPLRDREPDARDLTQPVGHQFSAPGELGPHLPDTVLRPVERGKNWRIGIVHVEESGTTTQADLGTEGANGKHSCVASRKDVLWVGWEAGPRENNPTGNIEYAMLQGYGEGFEMLQASGYDLDLLAVARLWTHASVVRSWLLDLLVLALEADPKLAAIRGFVQDSGEGRWTLHEAIERSVPMPALADALFARFTSRQAESFSAKVIAALRNQFGGHAVTPEK